jgi:hypothetical protein
VVARVGEMVAGGLAADWVAVLAAMRVVARVVDRVMAAAAKEGEETAVEVKVVGWAGGLARVVETAAGRAAAVVGMAVAATGREAAAQAREATVAAVSTAAAAMDRGTSQNRRGFGSLA